MLIRVLILFLLTSCSLTSHKDQHHFLKAQLSILKSYFPPEMMLSQVVKYSKPGDSDQHVQVHFSKNENLAVSVLSTEGIELLSLVLIENDLKISTINSEFNDFFSNFVLPDMMFTFASAEENSRLSGKPYLIKATKNRRLVFSQGKLIREITFSDERSSLYSNIKIENLELGYTINIKNIN